MVVTVQSILDSLKVDEYVYYGDASYKRNHIHFAVLSYDISAVQECEKNDVLFVIPPDGFLSKEWLSTLEELVRCPAALIIFVKDMIFNEEIFDEPTRFPVIFTRFKSKHSSKEFYRKINSLLRLSCDEEILYEGITTGLLWNVQKYERNDIVFLCKLLKLENWGPYRVFILRCFSDKKQMLLQIKNFLISKYQIRMVVIWQDYLVGIVNGNYTEREQLCEVYESIVAACECEIKLSLSSKKQTLSDMHTGLQEALRTFDLVGVLNNVDAKILGYDELGIYQVLFSLNDSRVFDDYCHAVFHKLWDYDRENKAALFQTLESYFNNELDIKKTASDLFVHINTLRYRINQIENILGRNLKNIRDLVEIETAFRVRTMSDVLL